MSGGNRDGRSGAGQYIGQPIPRYEDLRLVRGAGRFTDDIVLDCQVFAFFVRSPHASARIREIDLEVARDFPGVRAVLTGADYVADGLAAIRQVPIPADYREHTKPAFVGSPARPVLDEPHFPLALGYVRYVGEAIAVVVADTLAAARDAAELVNVSYDVLPSVSEVNDALADGAPNVWRSASGNLAMDVEFGEALMVEASGAIISRAREVAAWLLRADTGDVEFDDGFFLAGQRNRRLNVFEIAHNNAENSEFPVKLREPLTAEAKFTGRIPAYPTGSAICEIEIDPQTGAIRLLRYSSIDDVGQPINPLIVHGQTHGGIVQGVGQALLEQVVHAPDTAQVRTGSFVDYAMPRADDFPQFEIELVEHPTRGNPLRVKGGGEGGITPSPAAAINALSDHGVEHMDMPATPDSMWAVLQAGRNSR